ncbi:hypothetical protein [Microbacterium sp.]|uniref:hypothetical protein n=1 Tax=Microbacterium sp. TaxID=51671 RepID=UPI002810CE4C|nr:hypothetical protein [Microbacterium sp.]
MSKYMRIILDIEVEVTDVTEAAAYTMDWGRTEEGEIAMMPYPTPEAQIFAAVNQAVASGLAELQGRGVGFKLVSQSGFPREVVDGEHPAVTLPAMPARQDDGSIPGFN